MPELHPINTTQGVTGTESGGKTGLDVNISSVDVALGGGTEYTEGDTDASITGGAMMMEGAANTLVPAQGTALDGLLVNLGSNNDVNVSQLGSQNINLGAGAAGTGTQRVISASDDPAVTSLQIMDDWDESDRAKVNLIVGQAGVAAGSGASSATTQRVVLATDTTVPNVTGNIAHDGVDSGNPVKIGFKAKSFDGTEPGTSVAEDDRVDGISDPYGRQYVNDMHPRFWHVSSDYASAQTNASLRAAPGVGLKLYITDICISNGATAGNVTLLDGSGGTVLFEHYPGVNGGIVVNLRNPIALTANTALCLTSTTVTTHSVNISGFIAP